MNQLEDLLQQCTVKLTLPGRMGWGTGFFVASEWILTCAHVVQAAKGESVQVRWQNQEKLAQAVVERSLPDPYDLALLRVLLPTDANPPCVYLDAAIQSRDPLYLFGYPDQDFPNGCPATFNCEGLTGDEPALIKFAVGQVRPGMSGSPLLNQRTGKVCGMVKFTRDRSIDLGGGAIPTRVILKQIPQMRDLQQQSHQCDQRWSNLLESSASEIKEMLSRTHILQQRQSTSETPTSQLASVDELVQQVRSRLRNDIQSFHDTMPLWGVDHWVPLGDLFVDVNILEKLSSSNRTELNDLWQDFQDGIKTYSSYRSLDRIGLGKECQRISGLAVLERNRNLMVVGKPGSGKTTYLQRVVTECNVGNLQPHRVPVLIKLREFLEDGKYVAYSLKCYLKKYWQISELETQILLNQGRSLILLDGLDEVIGEAGKAITKEIKQFARAYPQVQMIVTCRTQSFTGETDWKALRFDFVEVADFNETQVRAFANHWFSAVERAGNREQGIEKSQEFLNQLFKETNKTIRELVISPILLSLTCAVFQQSRKFYSKRSKLYEESLELLLEQWDKSREIERDGIYRKLRLEQKLELLKHLAVKKFEQSQYVLFEQSELEEYIAEFLGIEHQESRMVLRAIECQHGLLVERANGLWSFSHLTFQEYFTAQWLNQLQYGGGLTEKIIEKRWQEVVRLAIDAQRPADRLLSLIKREIDYSVGNDGKLQQFLTANSKKAASTKAEYKLSAIRAFYFVLNRERDIRDTWPASSYARSFDLSRIIDSNLTHHLTFSTDFAPDLKLDYYLDVDFGLACIVDRARHGAISHAQGLSRDRTYLCEQTCEPELANELKWIKAQLPSIENWRLFQQWWDSYGKAWMEEFHQMLIEKRGIGHKWQFTDQQNQALERYYSANIFLSEILQEPEAISDTVRQEIEDSLLLPITEIRKRKPDLYR